MEIESVETKVIESESTRSELLKAMEYAEQQEAALKALPDDGLRSWQADSKVFKLDYWQKRSRLLQSEFEIFRLIGRINNSYFEVGKVLKKIKEENLNDYHANYGNTFAGKSFVSFEDYVKRRFNLKKSSAYALIGVYETFGGIDGKINPRYAAYNYSQLSEMLSLPEEKRNEIKPEMSVKEIRAYKKSLVIPKGDIDAVTDLNTSEKAVIESKPTEVIGEITVPPEKGSVKLLFKNKSEREKWVKEYKENFYLWVDIPPLGMRVYRYDFINGVSLLAVEYGKNCSCACYLLYCDDGTIHASDYLVSRVFNYLYSTPGQIVDWITRYRDEL